VRGSKSKAAAPCKPYSEVTEDEFIAGQAVSYLGFGGCPATAQFRRDGKRGVLDCRSSAEHVQPNVREGVARSFFRSLRWAPMQPPPAVHKSNGASSPPTAHCSYRQALRDWQRGYFAERLMEHKWNVAATARAIGISRVGLSKRLRAIGLRREPKPSPKRQATSKRAAAE